jgi:predicted ArsR family transcriptional regulator
MLTDPDPAGGLGQSRRGVLEALRAAGVPLGAQQIAERTGLHPNTARFHLDGLVDAGLAERQAEEPTGPGRPRVVYRANAADTPAGVRSYRLLAEMLTSLVADTLPEPGPAAVAAGQAWGRFLTPRPAPLERVDADEALRRLSAVLADIGFAPGPPEEEVAPTGPGARRAPRAARAGVGRVIPLRHCPFREVAAQQQAVVCSLHLGLMQGVLAEVRAPLHAHRLDPFVQPSLCLAHLTPRDGQPNDAHEDQPPSGRRSGRARTANRPTPG